MELLSPFERYLSQVSTGSRAACEKPKKTMKPQDNSLEGLNKFDKALKLFKEGTLNEQWNTLIATNPPQWLKDEMVSTYIVNRMDHNLPYRSTELIEKMIENDKKQLSKMQKSPLQEDMDKIDGFFKSEKRAEVADSIWQKRMLEQAKLQWTGYKAENVWDKGALDNGQRYRDQLQKYAKFYNPFSTGGFVDTTSTANEQYTVGVDPYELSKTMEKQIDKLKEEQRKARNDPSIAFAKERSQSIDSYGDISLRSIIANYIRFIKERYKD